MHIFLCNGKINIVRSSFLHILYQILSIFRIIFDCVYIIIKLNRVNIFPALFRDLLIYIVLDFRKWKVLFRSSNAIYILILVNIFLKARSITPSVLRLTIWICQLCVFPSLFTFDYEILLFLSNKKIVFAWGML